MKVNDLAKELGKTSQEVLDVLQKNRIEGKNTQSILSDEQASLVKKSLAQGNTGDKGAKESMTGEQPKKKIVAVYRPQNSAQGRGRQQGQGNPKRNSGDGKTMQGQQAEGAKTSAENTEKSAERTIERNIDRNTERNTDRSRNAEGNVSGRRNDDRRQGGDRNQNRDGGRQGGFQSRDGADRSQGGERRQGSFNRDGADRSQSGERRQGSFNRDGGDRNQSRDGSRQGGFQNRDGGRQGGFQNRDGGFNRDGADRSQSGERRQGSFNRDGGDRSQSRDGSRQGGFQNRDGGRQGGFQSRDGGRQGGFQNRDGGRQGGYQKREDGEDRRGQGYQNRDGARGGRNDGRRGDLNIPKPTFDAPVNQKQQNNKQSKNAYKNERFEKKDKAEEEMISRANKAGRFIKPVVKQEPKVEEEVKTIVIPEVITIKELAEKMKLQPSAIVKKLFLQGKIVTINQEVDFDQAEEIAMDFDVICEKEVKVDVIEELLKEDEENEADMVSRPPVVCVMGHVDHGKTSLLDAIRQTNVTSREAGGITQHIGAYVVEINGQKITFLDTPGHEAFTAMRMRGALATDIAVLVVAADDGVMPQTIEAINHAKAAGVEIIVAINKIDKPSANIDRVKQELTEYELIPEDWGGSTICVPVSAHTKEGISDLLEMILLTAEVKELKANPNRKARGLVIEAELDKGKGPVATVLVQKGTLHVGDILAVGPCYGRIRAMMDDKGRRVKEASPSTPVEILGLNDVPMAGEIFVSTENEKEARSFAETFISEGKNKLLEDTKMKLSLDDLFSQIKAGNIKELPIIVKADVQGSVEAVKQSLTKLSNEEVVVKVIHGGVGAINESDVTLASASNAIIIGFNVRPDVTAKATAEHEKVDIRLYRVIYQAIEDVEAAMKGLLDPVFEEKVIGHAVVRQTFKASGVGTIAGSYVLDGKFTRGCSARITRDGVQIFDGAVVSLKRFKDDVKEVATGYECGLVFEKFNDLQEDDMIEAYAMVEVPR
ncbi:MAG: translation initiation factor IF-2 [bacterium]|nr:translation initiation factor IF-2 [bacterium]